MAFFEIKKEWEKEWVGMPEFIQEDKKPFQQITIHFETPEDVQKFAQVIGRKLTTKTKYIWFPCGNVKKEWQYVNETTARKRKRRVKNES